MHETEKNTGNALVSWYAGHRRELPWRKTTDPYAIWISEIMLQQTRVSTVIEYYRRFLARFPDITSLAEAKEEDVLSAWKGLGYYSRARNLHQAAKVVRDSYQGALPRTYPEIRSLPGIGDYTAGAIAGIAYNQPYPAVDGNVFRVIARLQGIEEDIGKPSVKKQVAKIVVDMMPPGKAGEFNQALMELGATCCMPKDPGCNSCPLQMVCSAHRTGRESILPVKKKAKAPVEMAYWAAVIRQNGAILMEYRKDTQLLGKMWGLPLVRKEPDASPERLFSEQWGLPLHKIQTLGNVKHIFTHQVWRMEVILFSPETDRVLNSQLAWITPEKLRVLPVPKAFQKVLELVESSFPAGC